MESGRPLREAFAELLNDESARSAYATDPDGFLGAYGHGDLPGSLVAEAIVSFADSASPAVAEHLAPYVIAQSGAAEPGEDAPADPGFGLDLLATAPAGLELDEPMFDDTGAVPGPPIPHTGDAPTDAEPGLDAGEHPADLGDQSTGTGEHTADAAEHPADLDFGTGWIDALPQLDVALDAGPELDPGVGLDAIPDQAEADDAGFEPEPVTGPLESAGTEEPDQPAGNDSADDAGGGDGA